MCGQKLCLYERPEVSDLAVSGYKLVSFLETWMEVRGGSSQAPQDRVSGCLILQDTHGAARSASRRGALTALKFCLGFLE